MGLGRQVEGKAHHPQQGHAVPLPRCAAGSRAQRTPSSRPRPHLPNQRTPPAAAAAAAAGRGRRPGRRRRASWARAAACAAGFLASPRSCATHREKGVAGMDQPGHEAAHGAAGKEALPSHECLHGRGAHRNGCGRGCPSGGAAGPPPLRVRRLCQNSSSKQPHPSTPRQVCSSSTSASMAAPAARSRPGWAAAAAGGRSGRAVAGSVS